MREIVVPPVGAAFTFRWHPRWQFWRNGTGGAQVVGLDAAIGVVHLRVFALSDSPSTGIFHLPIVASRVASSLREIVEPSADVPDISVSAIQAWRAEYASGRAGAFSVAIGEAIELASETAGRRPDPSIESAYPLMSVNGEFTSVRVIGML